MPNLLVLINDPNSSVSEGAGPLRWLTAKRGTKVSPGYLLMTREHAHERIQIPNIP